jgi:hypothetical protein
MTVRVVGARRGVQMLSRGAARTRAKLSATNGFVIRNSTVDIGHAMLRPMQQFKKRPLERSEIH